MLRQHQWLWRIKKAKAFTLVELLIVVLITGVLAAIAIPSYQNIVDDTREREARATLRIIYNAQRMYHVDHNTYYNNEIGSDFLEEDASGREGLGAYMDDPNDDNDFYEFSVTAAGDSTFTAQAVIPGPPQGTLLTIDQTGQIN